MNYVENEGYQYYIACLIIGALMLVIFSLISFFFAFEIQCKEGKIIGISIQKDFKKRFLEEMRVFHKDRTKRKE